MLFAICVFCSLFSIYELPHSLPFLFNSSLMFLCNISSRSGFYPMILSSFSSLLKVVLFRMMPRKSFMCCFCLHFFLCFCCDCNPISFNHIWYVSVHSLQNNFFYIIHPTFHYYIVVNIFVYFLFFIYVLKMINTTLRFHNRIDFLLTAVLPDTTEK